jgi:peptide/nickel transport system substrate-binding protein
MSEFRKSGWPKRPTRGVAVLLVAATAVAAALASNGTAGLGKTAAGKTIVVAVTNTPPNIDASSSAQFIESEAFTQTMSRLFDYKTVKNSGGAYIMQSAGYQPVVGSLVTHWTVSANKKTITVDLRKGVKNYLGHTFDAKDVVYTLNRLLALKGTATFYVNSIGITKPSNYVVLNKYKLQFRLDFPAEMFFKMLAIPHLGIEDSVEFKKHATKADPWAAQWAHTNSAGFGPYHITQNQQGIQTVFTADPNYWGPKVDVGTVIMKEVPTSSNRLALLKGGAIDIAEYLLPREWTSLKSDSNVKVYTFAPAQTHSVLYMTTSIKPFDNKLVRQAISYAMPYDDMVKAVGLGTARRQMSPLPANYEFYNPKLDPYTLNLAKAKALLKKAGFPNGFSTTITYSNDDPTIEQLAVSAQGALAKIGIKAGLNKLPLATWSQGFLSLKYPMSMLSEGAFIPDYTYALHLWYYGPKSKNFLDFTNYHNPQVNKLMDEANHTFDQAARKKLATEEQRLILQDAPVVYLVEPGVHFSVRKNIGGVSYYTYSALHFELLTKG